jgi:hypothetical protein
MGVPSEEIRQRRAFVSRASGIMPNTKGKNAALYPQKSHSPSILKGGVDDAVGRGGLDSATQSQIAPGVAPAAQPDMKKERV